MREKEYLNESGYQKTKKGMLYLGVGIIVLGLIIVMIMVIAKINGGAGRNAASREVLQQELSQLKPGLERRYAELKARGVRESWDYKDADGYEMFLIDTALDPQYAACEHSSRYTDNDVTREYCNVKAQLHALDEPSGQTDGDILFTIVPALMVLLPCLAIGAMLIMTAKGREILAFHVQQVRPVAQEGVDKMSPTISKAAGSIAKGIKDGLKDGDGNRRK